MTPGLANGPPFPSEAKKGSTVAVASLELPTVPMIVGICEIDVCALSNVQGAKGHAVRSLHWDGDEIWGWSHGGKPGGFAPRIIDGWSMAEDSSSRALDKGAAGLRDSRTDAESFEQDSHAKHGNSESRANQNNHVNREDGNPWESVSVQSRELTSKGILVQQAPCGCIFADRMSEVDDIFRNAFLFAMYQHQETHPNDMRHGLNFPIPQSLFVSNLILPFLPTFTEADTNAMQIKKTSWKSAKKFIKALEKEKLLKSKDRNGGETVVQDVDFGDPAILAFKPYELPRKETTVLDSGGERATTSATSINDESIGQQLKKLSLFKPKEKLAPIFTSTGSNMHSFYLTVELRSIVTAYIELENLISATNKRLVNLNPTLANAIFDGQSSMDREVLVKGTVPRDAL